MKVAAFVAFLCLSLPSFSQEHHHDAVNKRGEMPQGMGFSQTGTTHHFLLTKEGGVIQVTANDSADKQSIEQVQQHFAHIAQLFAKGDFNIPHFVHDQTPPGVPTMKRLKAQIQYVPENLPDGARMRIQTSSEQARRAIHDFLIFQIRDHKTGDPETIQAALHPN
jgi:hypothetical protein